MLLDRIDTYTAKYGFFCVMIIEDRQHVMEEIKYTLGDAIGLKENKNFFFACTRKEAYKMYEKLHELGRAPQIVLLSDHCNDIDSEKLVNRLFDKYPDIYLLLYSVKNSIPYQPLPVKSLYNDVPSQQDLERSIKHFLLPNTFDADKVGMGKARFEHDIKTHIERAKMEESDISGPDIKYAEYGKKEVRGPDVDFGKAGIVQHSDAKDTMSANKTSANKRFVHRDGSTMPEQPKPKWAKKSWDVD